MVGSYGIEASLSLIRMSLFFSQRKKKEEISVRGRNEILCQRKDTLAGRKKRQKNEKPMGRQQLWTADSSDAKQMTVSEIYRWFVENVSYFADKGDIPSTTDWKVSKQLLASSMVIILHF